jgi:glycosyltransferase involved in cell wall biosynthesis
MNEGGLPESNMRTASVLIRTLNEERFLARTLTAVLSQTPAPFEVFVIDSGSTDRTVEIAGQFPVTVMTIPSEQWSYPRALNLGAASATGEIVVCLSAHCLPLTTDWLGLLLRHFDDERVAAVWGQELNPSRASPAYGPPVRLTSGSPRAGRVWGLSNANSALRRDLWQLHPFDERLPAAEDKAWGLEMVRRGWVIVHDPAAVVMHERHPPSRAFKRSRAVSQGYRMTYPEATPNAGAARHIVTEAGRVIRERLSDPRPSRLWTDVRQGWSGMFHLLGGFFRGRRRDKSSDEQT